MFTVPIVDALESELETIEEHIFEKEAAQTNIERLYQLKRKVMQLKHAVALFAEIGEEGRLEPEIWKLTGW